MLIIPITPKIISNGYVDLVFKFDKPISPRHLGIGQDDRTLSIGLVSVIFE